MSWNVFSFLPRSLKIWYAPKQWRFITLLFLCLQQDCNRLIICPEPSFQCMNLSLVFFSVITYYFSYMSGIQGVMIMMIVILMSIYIFKCSIRPTYARNLVFMVWRYVNKHLYAYLIYSLKKSLAQISFFHFLIF